MCHSRAPRAPYYLRPSTKSARSASQLLMTLGDCFYKAMHETMNAFRRLFQVIPNTRVWVFDRDYLDVHRTEGIVSFRIGSNRTDAGGKAVLLCACG
jgi:hypothetical protein